MVAPAPLDLSRARDFVLEDTHEFGATRDKLAAWIPVAVERACGVTATHDGRGTWKSELRRAWSLYDLCRVAVRLHGDDADVARVVRVEIAFGGSAERVGAFIWLMNSIVGMPAAYAWRRTSLRRSRDFGADVFANLWRALSSAVDAAPYR